MPILNIDISIIIVNYKGWESLRNCLKQLVKISSNSFKYEVIVVDNCSNDGQLEYFLAGFKSVNFYKNTGNNGFANACNYGAKMAKGKYLLFLNPDTLANSLVIEALLQTAQQHVDYGIISCQQIDKNNKSYNHNRLFFAPSRMFGLQKALYKKIHQSELKQRFSKSKKIIFPDWVSGSVVFISRKWFDKVAGWSEDYWMYFEDVDLCKKVTVVGGKVALIKTQKIIHAHGGSTRANYEIKALTKSEVIKSRHVYIHKHFNGFIRFYMQFTIMTNQIISKFFLGFIGLVFFFIPKFKVYRLLAGHIFKYYARLPFKHQWLSKKSVNYQ